MIRQLVLCVLLIGSQIAGQAICECHAAGVHTHDQQHAVGHDHRDCLTHQHHTTADPLVPATTDTPVHQDCDCHDGSPEFMVQRPFQLPDDLDWTACLTQPVTIAAKLYRCGTDRTICEYCTNLCRSSARADLGIWLR